MKFLNYNKKIYNEICGSKIFPVKPYSSKYYQNITYNQLMFLKAFKKKIVKIISITVVQITFAICLTGCYILPNTHIGHDLEGYFKTNDISGDSKHAYVEWDKDVLRIFDLENHENKNDTITTFDPQILPPETINKLDNISLVKPSFDIDFLTILFKLRPTTNSFPHQLNTELNGVVYIGYRRDIFNISYQEKVPGYFKRQIGHFGYSGGIFTGFGATQMNQWVTQDEITIEYDGVVWTMGFAGVFAVSQFSLGLNVGWDFLLDQNRDYWIYQRKPWIGMSVGINLN